MTMFVVSFTRRCIVLRIIAGFDAALHIRTFLARSALLKPRRLRAIRPRPLQYNLLVGGVFGLLWKGRDKEDKVPASVKQHLLKAQRALRDGDYEAAEEAYHDALRRLATSEYADAQAYIEARAVVLDKLANVYLEQGKLDKAEITFKEAMRFMLTAGMDQESEAMVEISLKLSKIYSNQKRYELAEAGFNWCVETADKLCTTSKSQNNTALWGMCLHNKGQYHLMVEQWESAITCLKQALKLSEEVFEHSHTQVAVLHNDLATALDAGGKHNEAEYHARASLAIMSDACVTDSDVDVECFARVYYNLGMILSHQGKISEARAMLSIALDKVQDKSLQRHIAHILETL
jgi:tetratricopeptide (TPR) repeat protein